MTEAALAHPASRSTGLLWVAWIAISLFVNFDLGAGLYSSQLLLVIAGLVWAVLQLYRFDVSKLGILLSLAAFTFWSFLIENTGNSGRFFPEFGKWAILGLSFAILTDLNVEASFDSITLALPVFTAVLTLLTRLFGNWDTYDPLLHRLGVPQLGGSPNTASYVFALCLLLVHYQWTHRRSVGAHIALGATYLVLMYALLASQSRGGLLMYVAGALFMLKGRWRFAAFVLIGVALAAMTAVSLTPALARFNLIGDARDTGGTGRAIIWAQLLNDLLQHPIRIIWGNGPGAINFYLFGVYLIQSGHSMYVEVLYAFGLIGLALLFAWFIVLYRKGISRAASDRRGINMAMWVALLIGFALDADAVTAQILWFTPLIGALMIPSTPVDGSTRTSPSHAGCAEVMGR